MIEYKMDVIAELKEAGYNSTRILREHIIGQGVMTKLRNKSTAIDLNTIDNLCRLLGCQPGNIIRYVPDEKD